MINFTKKNYSKVFLKDFVSEFLFTEHLLSAYL